MICLAIPLLYTTALFAQRGMDAYNMVWTSQSRDASGSMPCGGGDIGLNVWVENGDLLIYAARSGSFDENNALLKAGRLRIRFFPNPFSGGLFKQELHLREGYVTINGTSGSLQTEVKIWVDVFHPEAHIDIRSSQKITTEAAYESWRFEDRVLPSRENFGNSWKWAAPKNNPAKKDGIFFRGNEVVFYHKNADTTIFDATVSQQGIDAVKTKLYNPLHNLVFGGRVYGSNFIPAGESAGTYAGTPYRSWKLKTNRPANRQQLHWQLHTEQVPAAEQWYQSLLNHTSAAAADAFAKTTQWWRSFWDRSYIHIGGRDTVAWQAGRNFQLFRYLLACNARGAWPTKFNGGLFTTDPVYTKSSHGFSPDFREWGGGLHTAQNQRLVYFPMIRNGDWDLLQPQLDFYLRLLGNAEWRSRVYWQHEGACFTEQMENYGLPDYAEYGQKRPAGFDKGVEYNAWLEYEWDTVLEFCLMMLEEERYTGKDISDRLPFLKSCLRFFDEHYQYLARLRSAKTLDGNGKLVLYPGSAAETFKMATNASSTIAALRVVTQRMLSLPEKYLAAGERKQLDSFLKRIPDISYASFNGHTTIAPARSWERINNQESPQLYPVFPWGIYGIGRPGLDTARNTWLYDTNVIRFRSHIGWKQDNIWAARLGLTDEAWRLSSLKLQNAERRFPVFWGPGFDWVPDHNWGGSGMLGLQEMLLQTDDKKIFLFPAWPPGIDVHFKLHAPYQTTVEAEWKNGKLSLLKVIPEERSRDVQVMLTSRPF
ncbi:hypothetical protein GWC94_16190 [Sediminibacterium sp. WSJ-3]|nr:hypothetical protein [Sediminibacterium soli]